MKTMEDLILHVRRSFPKVDVRTDQCDIVRLLGQKVAIGIAYESGEFKAEVISLEDDSDFDTTSVKSFKSTSLDQFLKQLDSELTRLDQEE